MTLRYGLLNNVCASNGHRLLSFIVTLTSDYSGAGR